jgi:hypothetical protein
VDKLKKLDILKKIDFGNQIAEDEAKHLREYFVETNQWKALFDGKIDIVYGAKGSGKTALYSLLVSNEASLNARGIQVIPAENPRGAAVFSQLMSESTPDEQQLRGLWKLYFLCLVGERLRRLRDASPSATFVIRKLEESTLLAHDGTLAGMFLGWPRPSHSASGWNWTKIRECLKG